MCFRNETEALLLGGNMLEVLAPNPKRIQPAETNLALSRVLAVPAHVKFVSTLHASVGMPMSVMHTLFNAFVRRQAEVRAKSASASRQSIVTLCAMRLRGLRRLAHDDKGASSKDHSCGTNTAPKRKLVRNLEILSLSC